MRVFFILSLVPAAGLLHKETVFNKFLASHLEMQLFLLKNVL